MFIFNYERDEENSKKIPVMQVSSHHGFSNFYKDCYIVIYVSFLDVSA